MTRYDSSQTISSQKQYMRRVSEKKKVIFWLFLPLLFLGIESQKSQKQHLYVSSFVSTQSPTRISMPSTKSTTFINSPFPYQFQQHKREQEPHNGFHRETPSTYLASSTSEEFLSTKERNPLRRFRQAIPKGDDTDRVILQTTIPSMINLAVVPLVNSVDVFWVGRLGQALALAGQSAANQASFTIFFMIAFLPNITAPLVAKAVASGNRQEAQDRVSESIWLSTVLGLAGTLLLACFPKLVLRILVLEPNAPAMEFAAPYLRWRALGMVPSLISATGSAAYRGLLNTVTPLKVSLATNTMNLVLDPWLMFPSKVGLPTFLPSFGFVGAAIATAISETMGGLTYLRLLVVKQKLIKSWSQLWKPPPLASIWPLLKGGASMLFRQLAINIGFLVATRRAQVLDVTGVSGAAYGIVMQIYSIGLILLLSMQNGAAALVPSTLAAAAAAASSTKTENETEKQNEKSENANESMEEDSSGKAPARRIADRLLVWSSGMGIGLGILQYLLLPHLVPLFSTLPEVQSQVRIPGLIASLIHLVNGPILACEGIMIGMGQFRDLALITCGWIGAMVLCLMSPRSHSLNGIMWSILLSSLVQMGGVLYHYFRIGPLAVRLKSEKDSDNKAMLN